jgi:hypothetical protein
MSTCSRHKIRKCMDHKSYEKVITLFKGGRSTYQLMQYDVCVRSERD